jgi:RNA polymerase sigma-70 factor (ECF subfamily)
MPRTAVASTETVPARSALRRKTTAAPRSLRAPVPAASAAHAGFAAECLPLAGELQGAALRLTRNPDDARDLVQETLLRAMVAWSRFAPGSNVRAWLYRILTNSFINGYRKRRRHQRFATERPGDARMAVYGTTEDHTGDLAAALTEELLSDEVRAALARLGDDYREVVQRADLSGARYKDIADALDLPIGTVMSRLFRARRQLEGELREFAARDWGLRKAA